MKSSAGLVVDDNDTVVFTVITVLSERVAADVS